VPVEERSRVLQRFQEETGLRFANPEMLEQALTHSSFVNEYPDLDTADNQRLEFLGDAILDFIVGEWLYLRYPDSSEGELTGIRAHIVRTETLAAFGREIGLGAYLRLGRGEESSGGRKRAANLCAAFEAVVGAAYLDQGIEATREWVHQILMRHADEIDSRRAAKDAKSRLQEYTQAHLRITPSYRIINQEGPDHAKIFTAQVLVGQDVWGEGTGASKQAAEQAAATDALRTHRERRHPARFGD
jgi:ribonuclease-3